MAMASFIHIDYGSRVGAVVQICKAVNALGGSQVPVPSQWGAYDQPATLIGFLRRAAMAVDVNPPTDNIDYTGFQPLCNAIVAGINADLLAPEG